jgi:hypothetical protein
MYIECVAPINHPLTVNAATLIGLVFHDV